jgi:hypothetical protein
MQCWWYEMLQAGKRAPPREKPVEAKRQRQPGEVPRALQHPAHVGNLPGNPTGHCREGRQVHPAVGRVGETAAVRGEVKEEQRHATRVRLEWQLLRVELSEELDVAVQAAEIPLHNARHKEQVR